MRYQRYIGIDPGKSGGIAWIDAYGDVEAVKMPQTLADLNELFLDIAAEPSSFAMLEKVHSSPQMGVRSAFTFGENKGALKMGLTGVHIRFDEVTPQKWQSRLNCLSKGDKNVTKARAQGLFPHLKITHATADALLIAEYGRRKMEGIK